MFKIYITTNLINGKIYIGQTHYDNPKYLGSGVLLHKAIEKYGSENFEKKYLDEADNQHDLDLLEIYWIKKLNSQDRNVGYNIADGGWNNLTMNEEIKQKISNTLKGKYVGDNSFRKGLTLSEEHKKKISEANKGKVISEEHKKKISEANKGKVISEESKVKMSKSHKGKTLSEEHKKKISIGGRGRIYTEEQKNRLKLSNLNKTQKHSRTIFALCIKNNIIKTFNNISEAARFFNVTRQRIKNNSVSGWDLKVNNPEVDIKHLKNNKNASEGKNNTR